MSDKHLCVIAGLIVIVYAIYMTLGPGGDGVIFASVVGAIMALTGYKYHEMIQSRYIRPDLDASHDDASDELQQ